MTDGQAAYEAAYAQLRAIDSAAPSGDIQLLLRNDPSSPGVWDRQNATLHAQWEAIAAAVVANQPAP